MLYSQDFKIEKKKKKPKVLLIDDLFFINLSLEKYIRLFLCLQVERLQTSF